MGTSLTRAQIAAIHRLIIEENANRADALTSSCGLQKALQGLLQTAMIDHPKVNDLFDDSNGTLSTFAAQIKCAWAFGLIDDDLRHDLDCIRKIRNEFAHESEQKSFSTSPVREWLQNLSAIRDGRIAFKSFSRSEYLEAVCDIEVTLMALVLKKVKTDSDIEQLRAELHEMIKDTLDAIVPLPTDHEENARPT